MANEELANAPAQPNERPFKEDVRKQLLQRGGLSVPLQLRMALKNIFFRKPGDTLTTRQFVVARIGSLRRHRTLLPLEKSCQLWHVARHAPVAYLVVPKASQTALAYSVQNIRHPVSSDEVNRMRLTRLTRPQRKYFKFTFVRDPFQRLASFYMNKFVDTSRPYEYQYYLAGIFPRGISFAELVQLVCQIPDELADRHFLSQSRIVIRGKRKVDFIGRAERLPEEYEPIRRRYGFPPLTRQNESAPYDYRELYTEELVEQVAAHYAEDIECFGYQAAHQELLRACAGR